MPQKGFTLLELLAVLLIISVSTGLFLGMNFRQKESVQARSFASEMSQLMRTARSHAIMDGQLNLCEYQGKSGRVVEQLRGRSLAVPDKVKLYFADLESDESMVFASFFSDGSLIIENFELRAGDIRMLPEADPFTGRVRFVQQ